VFNNHAVLILLFQATGWGDPLDQAAVCSCDTIAVIRDDICRVHKFLGHGENVIVQFQGQEQSRNAFRREQECRSRCQAGGLLVGLADDAGKFTLDPLRIIVPSRSIC